MTKMAVINSFHQRCPEETILRASSPTLSAFPDFSIKFPYPLVNFVNLLLSLAIKTPIYTQCVSGVAVCVHTLQTLLPKERSCL